MSSVYSKDRANRGLSRKSFAVARKVVLMAVLLVVAAFMIFPFIWMLSASVKYNTEIFSNSLNWFPKVFHWSNYVEAFTKIDLLRYYQNTIKLSVCITVLQLITCSLAAYAFARLHFPGRDKLFLCYLGTMMVPWQAIMIPQFTIVKLFGLYNTHLSLILVQSFSVFGVFLLRQFMLGLPVELTDAARIDGCNEFQIYSRIILPLSKPALAILTIFTFTFVWNDFLGPLIYLSDNDLYTLQLGLSYFQGSYSMDYGLIMAGTVCSLVPIIVVYIIFQRYLIEGISFTGLKA